MSNNWEEMSASALAQQGWSWEQFEDAAFYAKDYLLGDLTPFSEFKKVENRPCDKMTATLHHNPYHVYRYRDHSLLVPADLGLDFDGVIDFGANEYGFTYTELSKLDGTLEEKIYTFDPGSADEDKVNFTKVVIQAPVGVAEFEAELQKAGSPELFFTGKRYSKFFEGNPDTVRKVVEIVKTPNSTVAYAEDATDVRASLDRYLAEERQYVPVENPDESLFVIADTFGAEHFK